MFALLLLVLARLFGFATDTHYQGRVQRNVGGSVHAAGGTDWAISAGFGTTATKAVRAGSDDEAGHIDIGSSGTGQAANPTAALTFKDGKSKDKNGADRIPKAVLVTRTDAAAAAGIWGTPVITATGFTVTFQGTPVATQTYGLEYCVIW
jgi:hypothetical protein